MPYKTKELIKAYNKEYFARPDVIARAKIRNAQRREKRRAYKKTERGKMAEKRYKTTPGARLRVKESFLKRQYGITSQDYAEMYKAQKGCCLICLQYFKVLHIDHCHTSGKVRGLLCGSCNRALGLLKDNTEFLLKGIEYLTSNKV